jgi:hypothetical protein
MTKASEKHNIFAAGDKNQAGQGVKEKVERCLWRLSSLSILYTALFLWFEASSGVHSDCVSSNAAMSGLIFAALETLFGGFTIWAAIWMFSEFGGHQVWLIVVVINLFLYLRWRWCPYVYVPIQTLIQQGPEWWLSHS